MSVSNFDFAHFDYTPELKGDDIEFTKTKKTGKIGSVSKTSLPQSEKIKKFVTDFILNRPDETASSPQVRKLMSFCDAYENYLLGSSKKSALASELKQTAAFVSINRVKQMLTDVVQTHKQLQSVAQKKFKKVEKELAGLSPFKAACKLLDCFSGLNRQGFLEAKEDPLVQKLTEKLYSHLQELTKQVDAKDKNKIADIMVQAKNFFINVDVDHFPKFLEDFSDVTLTDADIKNLKQAIQYNPRSCTSLGKAMQNFDALWSIAEKYGKTRNEVLRTLIFKEKMLTVSKEQMARHSTSYSAAETGGFAIEFGEKPETAKVIIATATAKNRTIQVEFKDNKVTAQISKAAKQVVGLPQIKKTELETVLEFVPNKQKEFFYGGKIQLDLE